MKNITIIVIMVIIIIITFRPKESTRGRVRAPVFHGSLREQTDFHETMFCSCRNITDIFEGLPGYSRREISWNITIPAGRLSCSYRSLRKSAGPSVRRLIVHVRGSLSLYIYIYIHIYIYREREIHTLNLSLPLSISLYIYIYIYIYTHTDHHFNSLRFNNSHEAQVITVWLKL